MSLPENVLYIDGRYLIDIASYGCGSGCSYCYVAGRGEPQILLKRGEIASSCAAIAADTNYTENSLISLCPNTEPFKSEAAAGLVLEIIKFFSKRLNPIQLSTKELIDPEVLKAMSQLSEYKNQICINISLPLISRIEQMEPFAADYHGRRRNFANIKKYHDLCSCLYIKPFIEATFLDLTQYIELIFGSEPDYICVGPHFSVQGDEPCLTLYDPGKSRDIFEKGYFDRLMEFSKTLSEVSGNPVFFSSTCVTAEMFPRCGCKMKLYNVSESLCGDCKLLIAGGGQNENDG